MAECIGCNKTFQFSYHKNKNTQKFCNAKCWAKFKYYKDKPRFKENIKRYRVNLKEKALRKINNGNCFCSNCGCLNIKILEVNHINGDGSKEYRRGAWLYHKIITNQRKIDDLSVLCKVCNIAEFVKQKYHVPFTIICKEVS